MKKFKLMCVHTLCSVTGEVDTTRINYMESEKERMEAQDELCESCKHFTLPLNPWVESSKAMEQLQLSNISKEG